MGNAYRDGKVHVLARKCATCIFRPGNLMHLTEGRVDEMVAEATTADSAIICHSTLNGDNAVCRGFYDVHPTAPAPGIARSSASKPAATFMTRTPMKMSAQPKEQHHDDLSPHPETRHRVLPGGPSA